MKTVVIGKSSFLAQSLRNSAPEFEYFSHQEALADTSWIRNAETVLNFSFSPVLRSSEYAESEDIDSRLAELIKSSSAHYIMMSTRMVYGQKNELAIWREDSPANPANAYAHSKLKIENNLTQILSADRLTILRIANVFGFEYGRSSFIGRALTDLAKAGVITFDMDASVIRDFISVNYFSQMVGFIAKNPLPGLYNLGSGIGISCGELAAWLIEGYGDGKLVQASSEIRDQFILDMNKTISSYSLDLISKDNIKKSCVEYGWQLCQIQN